MIMEIWGITNCESRNSSAIDLKCEIRNGKAIPCGSTTKGRQFGNSENSQSEFDDRAPCRRTPCSSVAFRYGMRPIQRCILLTK